MAIETRLENYLEKYSNGIEQAKKIKNNISLTNSFGTAPSENARLNRYNLKKEEENKIEEDFCYEKLIEFKRKISQDLIKFEEKEMCNIFDRFYNGCSGEILGYIDKIFNPLKEKLENRTMKKEEYNTVLNEKHPSIKKILSIVDYYKKNKKSTKEVEDFGIEKKRKWIEFKLEGRGSNCGRGFI
jgi:hypothetical protein